MLRDIMLANRNFPGINPLLAGEEQCSSGHCFGPAVREYYLIHYIVSGQGVFKTEGMSYSLSAGDLFLLRPGQRSVYTADSKNPWHYIWVGFSATINLDDIFGQNVISSSGCGSIFADLLEADHLIDGTEYFVCGKIYELISCLKNETLLKDDNLTRRYALIAKNFIETNYAKEISVQMISEHVNLNRCYFSTIFKKHIGKTPQNYLVDYRLSKAAHFMTAYHYTPFEAAKCCGYPDVFNFSRMFKRKYGVSPRIYQMQNTEAKENKSL